MPARNDAGGFAYLPGLPFASNGVAELPGFAISHVTLPALVPVPDAYATVANHLTAVGRPVTALCGMELRLPAALPLDGFRAFNAEYLQQLEKWGATDTNGGAMTARTNVAPRVGAPPVPALAAFSYTMPDNRNTATFVISGAADHPDGTRYPDGLVRRGETSPDALREKADCVVDNVAGRIADLAATWDGAASVHLYAAHDIAGLVKREILDRRGLTPERGLTWHDAEPPVLELALEIDVRRYGAEAALRAD